MAWQVVTVGAGVDVIVEDVLDEVDEVETGGGVVEHLLSLPQVRPGQQPVIAVAVGSTLKSMTVLQIPYVMSV